MANQSPSKSGWNLFLPDGQPASDFKAEFFNSQEKLDLKMVVENSRVTANLVELGKAQFPKLKVSTNDGRFIQAIQFDRFEIRHICETGLQSTLQPVRQITICVVDENDKPVIDAELIGTNTKTDEGGKAFIRHSCQSAICPLPSHRSQRKHWNGQHSRDDKGKRQCSRI